MTPLTLKLLCGSCRMHSAIVSPTLQSQCRLQLPLKWPRSWKRRQQSTNAQSGFLCVRLMDAGSARWEINATLRERGFQHVGSPDQYRGPIRVGNSVTEIILDIPDLTFVKLPRIEFVDRAALALPVIAHLEDGTGLCYADRSLLRLDPYQPGASILRILGQAEETIAKSLAGKVQNEVATEFPSYWRGQNILVLFDRNKQTQRARFAVANDGRARSQTLLVEDKQHIPAGFRKGGAVAVVSAAGNLHAQQSSLCLKIWRNSRSGSCSRRHWKKLLCLHWLPSWYKETRCLLPQRMAGSGAKSICLKNCSY